MEEQKSWESKMLCSGIQNTWTHHFLASSKSTGARECPDGSTDGVEVSQMNNKHWINKKVRKWLRLLWLWLIGSIFGGWPGRPWNPCQGQRITASFVLNAYYVLWVSSISAVWNAAQPDSLKFWLKCVNEPIQLDTNVWLVKRSCVSGNLQYIISPPQSY